LWVDGEPWDLLAEELLVHVDVPLVTQDGAQRQSVQKDLHRQDAPGVCWDLLQPGNPSPQGHVPMGPLVPYVVHYLHFIPTLYP